MLQLRSWGSATVLALTLVTPSISTGQTPPPPEWSVVTTFQIKPDFRTEFEAAQKEVSAAYKKGGAKSRLVVQTLFGDLGEYITIVPLSKLADLDEPTVLVKALGDAGAQRLLKRTGAYIVSVHRATSLAMNDVSIQTPGDPGGFAHVAIYRLLPGKGADFNALLTSDILPAMKKAGVTNLWMSRPIFGGDSNERVMVQPLHKLAELDGGPTLTKALGAEGARKVNIKQATMVESVHRSIVRVRPELSYMPAPPQP